MNNLMNNLTDYPLIVFALALFVMWFSARIGSSFLKRQPHLEEGVRKDFSIILTATLTLLVSTVGFGDIVPVSSMARMLAITEAVCGMFYLTLMIARLVSLYSDRGSPDAVSRGRKVARRTGIRRL
jgi:hypothetical protein